MTPPEHDTAQGLQKEPFAAPARKHPAQTPVPSGAPLCQSRSTHESPRPSDQVECLQVVNCSRKYPKKVCQLGSKHTHETNKVNLRLSLINLSIAVCTQNAIKKASKSGAFERILDAGAAQIPPPQTHTNPTVSYNFFGFPPHPSLCGN